MFARVGNSEGHLPIGWKSMNWNEAQQTFAR